MKNEIKKLLILVRHGERIDRVGATPKCGMSNPELTEKGKVQSFDTSKTIIDKLVKFGINQISPNLIQIRSSPYLRTIQTSVYLSIGLNTKLFEDKNITKKIEAIYIDNGLRKRIKSDKKYNNEDIKYISVNAYSKFDEEIKKFEFLEGGGFDYTPETKEQCEKRSFDYVNNILSKEIENHYNNKVFIIISHRGPLKFIVKKLGIVLKDKKDLDYCSQFYFDVSNGIENSKFLEFSK